jgi:hypothetical protein
MKQQAAELKAEKGMINDQSMEMLQARNGYNASGAHQSSSHTDGEESDVVAADTETDEDVIPAKRHRQESTRPQGNGPRSNGKGRTARGNVNSPIGRTTRGNVNSPICPRLLPLRSATKPKKSCSVAKNNSTQKEPSQKEQYSDIFGTALPVTITQNPHFSTSFSPPLVGMTKIPKLAIAKKSAPINEDMDVSDTP